MRKLLASVVGFLLLASLPSEAAAGGKPRRSSYHSIGLSASWSDHRSLDRDHYLLIRWRIYAYDSSEEQDEYFYAALYRTVNRCEWRHGRDRCSRGEQEWGRIRDRDAVRFAVDRRLTAGSLEGTFQIRRRDHGEPVGEAKRVHVVAALTGRGDVYRRRSEYDVWDGKCREARYRFDDRYRRAQAQAILTGDYNQQLEGTRDGYLSEDDGVVIRRSCD